jgi:sugar/nucleoside kinase (ribokinase family)
MRAALRSALESDVDILFVDERALLELLHADLGEACAWISRAVILAIVFMGSEGVVLIDGQEQVFIPPQPNFLVAPDRYVRGFLAAFAENRSLEECADAGTRSIDALKAEMGRLNH